MADKLLDFASKNPLGAFVVIAGLAALVVASAFALPPATRFVRAIRSKNGNGNGNGHGEPEPPKAFPSGPTVVGPLVTKDEFDGHVTNDSEIHEGLDGRLRAYENLTNNGKRLDGHFEQVHAHAGVLQAHTNELAVGGRRITGLEGEVKGLRSDFSEHRGEVRSRLEGLESGQERIDTGQIAILAELRAMRARA